VYLFIYLFIYLFPSQTYTQTQTHKQNGIQPPGILTWAALLLYNLTEDILFLKQTYETFSTNNDWFYSNRDFIGDGLCWWNGTDSGWDTSPVCLFIYVFIYVCFFGFILIMFFVFVLSVFMCLCFLFFDLFCVYFF
jgi:hypothetical protein